MPDRSVDTDDPVEARGGGRRRAAATHDVDTWMTAWMPAATTAGTTGVQPPLSWPRAILGPMRFFDAAGPIGREEHYHVPPADGDRLDADEG